MRSILLFVVAWIAADEIKLQLWITTAVVVRRPLRGGGARGGDKQASQGRGFWEVSVQKGLRAEPDRTRR